LTTAGALREELLYQLTHPVQWQRSVERMVSGGVSTFVEMGPGEVLCGLVRRITPGVRTLSINGVDPLAQ
jgi:[acyl-carrier-protein] S-malonyltransferase